MWEHFNALAIPHAPRKQSHRRYSVTADILAYETCSLQYGAFAARKYEPALVVQLFYGTIIHQVLDRAHAHYQGLLGPPLGTLPTSADIENYFKEVENSLVARKIRAGASVKKQALDILQRFNSLEGPSLYPRIVDTECHLQVTQKDYILHGNVDVLATSPGGTSVEIWDYKGASKPSLGDDDYKRYVFQMQVYADLYRCKTGNAPAKAILYFLNELGGSHVPSTRPANAILEVDLDPAEVKKALQSFDQTVLDIENCRSAGAWPAPKNTVAKPTCDACDLRWKCLSAQSFGRKYEMHYP